MSLRDKQTWQTNNERTEYFTSLLNRYDNYEIKWETDQDSFKTNLDKVPEFAEAVTNGITDLSIEDQLNRDAISQQIKTIRFTYGKSEYKFDGTTFVVHSDLGETKDAAAVAKEVKGWLLDNLG